MAGDETALPFWAVLTVWGVVNAVNVLQAIGFLSRIWRHGDRRLNHALGFSRCRRRRRSWRSS